MTATLDSIRPELPRLPAFASLISALSKWAIRRAMTDFAATKASSAATDLYRSDIPFLLKLGQGASSIQCCGRNG